MALIMLRQPNRNEGGMAFFLIITFQLAMIPSFYNSNSRCIVLLPSIDPIKQLSYYVSAFYLPALPD